MGLVVMAMVVFSFVAAPGLVTAQTATAPGSAQQVPPTPWQFGGFIDVGRLGSSTSPSNHLFRNRGTTPRLDEWDLNMTAAYFKKAASETARLGIEVTVQEGHDSEIFGFSATAPIAGHWRNARPVWE